MNSQPSLAGAANRRHWSRRRSFKAALWAIVLFAALLTRTALIGHHSLWADEWFSLAIATGHSLEHPARVADRGQGDYLEEPSPVAAREYCRYLEHDRPPAGLGRVTRAVLLSDTSPPLYYYVVYGWTQVFGTGDAALHGLSVCFALLCLPLLAKVALRVAGRPAVLPTLALFAIAPSCLCYSVEGRMYSMVWWLALLLVHCTLRWKSGGGKARWIAWALVAAANLATHYYSAFVVAACGLWLLCAGGPLRRGPVVGAGLLAALLVAPWFRLVPQSLAQWRVTEGWLNGFPQWRTALIAPAHLLWSYFSNGGKWGGSGVADKTLCALIVGTGLFLWRRRGLRALAPGRVLLLLWLTGACVGPLVFDLWRSTCSVLVPRYALSGMPAAFLLLGYGISRLRPLVALFVATAIVGAWIPGVIDLYTIPSRDHEPYREAAAEIEAFEPDADLVLVHSVPSGVIGLARHLEPTTQLISWVEQLGVRQVPDDISRLTRDCRNVDLVEVHTVGAPVPERAWLEAHGRVERTRVLQGIRITRFVLRQGDRF